MPDDEEKDNCYNCHWARQQAGSSHMMCPISLDICTACKDCIYWKVLEAEEAPTRSHLGILLDEDPWPGWEQWVIEVQKKQAGAEG